MARSPRTTVRWLHRLAWAAIVVLATAGLYGLGQRAVGAAMASLERPQVRQATFNEDDRTIHRRRPGE